MAASATGGCWYSITGVSTGTNQSTSSTCSVLSPWLRGIRGLTSATTNRACATAAGSTSTLTPRLT